MAKITEEELSRMIRENVSIALREMVASAKEEEIKEDVKELQIDETELREDVKEKTNKEPKRVTRVQREEEGIEEPNPLKKPTQVKKKFSMDEAVKKPDVKRALQRLGLL